MNSTMAIKVTTACPARFHAFDQAQQLHRHGMLHRLITQYPKFKTRQWGIPNERVISRLTLGMINWGIFKGLHWRGVDISPHLLETLHRRFSSTLSQFIPRDTDILIGWSSFLLEAIEWAKSENIISIVDHGSLHERTVREILSAECEQFGFVPFGNWQYEWLIEKEEAEFAAADYINVCSHIAKKTMEDNGVPASKIVINHLGADISMFYPGKKEDKTFRVIFCGGINPLKGVHYLVSAFKELALPDSELWLIGTPPTDEKLKRILQKNSDDAIILKGSFPQANLRAFYTQGSVFVLPSLADGWGMVVLQAMACGLPVIVTDKTGAADAVTENINGFIIKAQSVDALKEKLLFLYENTVLCEEMGTHAVEAVKQGYHWDDYGNRLKHFMELI